MTFIAEAILILANVLMAWHHSNLIEDGRPIKHGIWGGLYLVVAVLFSWLNQSWELLLCSLFARKLVFDLSLNLFRGLGLLYVSPELSRYKNLWDAIRKGKIIDWLHYKIFGSNSLPYVLFYLAGTIILTAKIIFG